MPVYATKTEDIRVLKTEKAMDRAMLSLLGKQNFKKIAVTDICEESLISRATFYTRFTDKYSFLNWWMLYAWPESIIDVDDVFESKAEKINGFVDKNKIIIKNLFLDADDWTLNALFDALCSIFNLKCAKTINGLINPEYIVLSNFYVGGMIQYIIWQVKNGFPQDVSTMNIHLYNLIGIFENFAEIG